MDKNQTTRRNFLLKIGAASGVAVLSSPLLTSSLWAASNKASLLSANLKGSGNHLNVSFSLDQAAQYKVFTLTQPDRVVIDFAQTALKGNLGSMQQGSGMVNGIRYATRPDGSLRVVLDMASAVQVESQLQTNRSQHLLTLTLKGGNPSASPAPARPSVAPPTPIASSAPTRRREVVIVIDPGHGGRDPGDVGKLGTREKDVVLAVSRKLKAKIDASPNMKAVLTRSDDRKVPLRKRLEIARANKADMFISVHADASVSSRVHGSSVYVLSKNGASSEAARLLQDSENQAFDLRLGDNPSIDNRIAPVLLDLSQNLTLDRSLALAKRTLGELAKVNNPLRKSVESAGFLVLKSPDVPSVLVETAFLSNINEEKRLRTPQYQQRLADAIYRGITSYKKAYLDSEQNYASL